MTSHGYADLLNIQEQPHWTVVLSDFRLPVALRRGIADATRRIDTRLVFISLPQSDRALRARLRDSGVDLRSDYVSFHAIVKKLTSLENVERFCDTVPRSDLAALDFPLAEARFEPQFAVRQFRVVMKADYQQQDLIAAHFFDSLERRVPYDVVISSGDNDVLRVADSQPWFAFAGRLRRSERRTLPGGEVAYTGDAVTGTFVADGGILATPQVGEDAEKALFLATLGREVARDPIRFRIKDGNVTSVASTGTAGRAFAKLLDNQPGYRKVTEVGISFNRACRTFDHKWPDGVNEGRPGVHLGIGGDPDVRDTERGVRLPLIHIDFMAATCAVTVNERRFLRARA